MCTFNIRKNGLTKENDILRKYTMYMIFRLEDNIYEFIFRL